jgi:hypothetical protein
MDQLAAMSERSSSKEVLVEQFKRVCKTCGIEIVAIASGLAVLRNDRSLAIVTLPRGDANRTVNVVWSLLARANHGRFEGAAPAPPLYQLSNPSDCMSWEAFESDFEIFVDPSGHSRLQRKSQA